MQYISAYALASLSGKEPNADTVKSILNATGQPVDNAEVDRVVASLKGKNIEELIKKGTAKLGSGAAAPAAKKDDKKKDDKKKDEKKKEKKPEPEPEVVDDDLDGPGDLFG